ncbi:uncharacterized protein [Drosophila kikkawai]|uniref:Uncharacterized protein isoform X2 n=1 Tax=Drosophila kikkawai TaxID=30033 RepID=A0ABM4GE10_DROKI
MQNPNSIGSRIVVLAGLILLAGASDSLGPQSWVNSTTIIIPTVVSLGNGTELGEQINTHRYVTSIPGSGGGNATSKSLESVTRMRNNPTPNGEITEVSTNVTLYMEKIPRLQVRWQDNLPEGTSYNVLVSALNNTRCPDAPCSEYGIKRKPAAPNFVYLPLNPNLNVESVDCNYMFGCQYKVTVETSNAMVRRSARVFVPQCLEGKCSCQFAPTPPRVLAMGKMLSNDTISISISILASEQLRKEQESRLHDTLGTYKMQLKINEETNPSLPWGGVLKHLLTRAYKLSELGFKATPKGFEGSMKLGLSTQLKEKASLSLQAVIIDPAGCEGPRSVAKVPVPANPILLTEGDTVSNSIMVMSGMLIAIILAGLIMLLLRCRRVRTNAKLQMQEQIYIQTFASSAIEMEDNVNYVDKYVEKSHVLGLADIFEVPHSAIQIGRLLGEGAFGRVHEATAINLRRMRGTTIVAVKQLKRESSRHVIG